MPRKKLKDGEDIPSHFITHREDIPLRMKMFPHANFPKTNDRHNAYVQRQHRLTLLIPGDHRDTKTLGSDGVRLEAFGLCVSMRFRVLWLCSGISGGG